MAQKVLVCGDVRGNFRLLFERIDKLNKKKGPFDLLLCVGDFFGSSPSNWEPYKNGSLKVPLLTYILGPNSEEHIKYYDDMNGCELCSNVYYLGKRGILTSSGLKIAYKDVETVRNIAYKGKDNAEYLGIDVLLTSQWPRNVTNLVGNVDDDVKKASDDGSDLVAWLVSQTKPRYHFVGLCDVFYERQPYRNEQPNGVLNTHCTRFISLSSLTGKKWMYGAVLTPIDKIKKEELYQRTSDETEIPYKNISLGGSKSPKTEQYFFDMNSRDRGNASRKRKRDFSQEKCWFCLAGGQDLQTVVSIGTEAYAAVPKGGMARRHLMICPVKHLESYLHLPRSAREEVAEMKKAITRYYEEHKEVPVFFERYYKTSHMQLNAVPVPASCSGKLMSSFASHAERSNLELVELPRGTQLGEVLRLDTPYLYVELPDGEKFYIKCGDKFPIHFARLVLASKAVLNAKNKVDWKECVLPEEEEQKLTGQLRKEFAEFYSTD
ncbi:UNVERIFIED_CONTAM: hypothetical protein PYX00_001533 [Menopon gallinae]|uniref:CWF19-like protein 1 n=1 Tax=Menopon gallinae TaxID=328185 RepID=A0AAW2IDQ4_9NEOP